MEEQNPSKLTGGVVILPVNSGSAIPRIEDERLESWVERGQQPKIGRVLGVFVPGVYGSPPYTSLPLLPRHFFFDILTRVTVALLDDKGSVANCVGLIPYTAQNH